MDKYEFNIKVEQLRKLANKGDFETALKIVDTIDWKKVRNANLLSMVAQVYEKNEEYQEAKDILLLAFERAPIGKRLLFKLTDLAVKEGNTEEAEAYYREFCDLAVDDPRQHLLRYMILKQKGAPAEQLIHSLEGYTAEELDEKWLYELAVLYREAGEEAACVAACDKIMLMFGLGKYVDKAMDLKLQYAPLTKYQMDLVENREKYEAKLRAVEQSFNGVADREEDYLETAPLVGEPEEEPPEEPAILTPPPATGGLKPAGEADTEARPGPSAAEMEGLSPRLEYEPDAIAAAVKQAEVEEHLAREMSKLSMEEDVRQDGDEAGNTRVLGNLKRARILSQDTTILPDLNAADGYAAAPAPVSEEQEKPSEALEPSAAVPEVEEFEEEEMELPRTANHIMIEAKTPERGLEMAAGALRQIQAETGIKNPVAKITGSKLNNRGILACADKLRGKDLMIEEAGDLSPGMLKELEKLMAQDTSGMRVILIDNPKQMELIHAKNPLLASKFECIGCGDAPAGPAGAAGERRELPLPKGEASGAGAAVPASDLHIDDGRPVRHITPVRDAGMRVEAPADYEDEALGGGEEMDIDEFAQYACQYASEIDCSITGKSMLALYERIEIMEEDGIPLTRENAEGLIEEAADRAEKPSLGRRITGVFSSKYDKDGLLILKEEHFI